MPTEVNPVKQLREVLGLSLAQLEYAAKIHRQTIIRTEQGCYAQIPPRLHNYLLARTGVSYGTLIRDYNSWVAQKRRESFGRLNLQLPEFDVEKHPFVQWREASEVGQVEICRNFCVHPSTMGRFENKLVMQSIPEQLREALAVSGYSTHVLDDLSIRYNLFRELQLAIKNSDNERIGFARNNANVYRIIHKDTVPKAQVAGF